MRLVARTGVRVDASRSSAVAAAIVAVVVALIVGAWVLASRPRAIPMPAGSASVPISVRTSTPGGRASPSVSVSASASASASGRSASGTVATSSSVIVVDVAGKVRRPGLYRLADGVRVDDAVRAAGGALPGVDLSGLNLAARLTDGQQVVVGMPAAAGPVGNRTSSGVTASPVHLNTATVEQLETLPGVGPVLAQHIVDYRSAHGSFASVAQLNDVPGIGDSKFAALQASVVL